MFDAMRAWSKWPIVAIYSAPAHRSIGQTVFVYSSPACQHRIRFWSELTRAHSRISICFLRMAEHFVSVCYSFFFSLLAFECCVNVNTFEFTRFLFFVLLFHNSFFLVAAPHNQTATETAFLFIYLFFFAHIKTPMMLILMVNFSATIRSGHSIRVYSLALATVHFRMENDP